MRRKKNYRRNYKRSNKIHSHGKVSSLDLSEKSESHDKLNKKREVTK